MIFSPNSIIIYMNRCIDRRDELFLINQCTVSKKNCVCVKNKSIISIIKSKYNSP